MGIHTQFELQKVIYQRLTADSGLMATISGVYDYVPQNTSFPYVTLGEARASDWSSKTGKGLRWLITLHVFSRQGGRKEAAGIVEKLHELLHEASLTPVGMQLVMLRFESSDMLLEEDGLTHHGMIRFRAYTQ